MELVVPLGDDFEGESLTLTCQALPEAVQVVLRRWAVEDSAVTAYLHRVVRTDGRLLFLIPG